MAHSSISMVRIGGEDYPANQPLQGSFDDYNKLSPDDQLFLRINYNIQFNHDLLIWRADPKSMLTSYDNGAFTTINLLNGTSQNTTSTGVTFTYDIGQNISNISVERNEAEAYRAYKQLKGLASTNKRLHSKQQPELKGAINGLIKLRIAAYKGRV